MGDSLNWYDSAPSVSNANRKSIVLSRNRQWRLEYQTTQVTQAMQTTYTTEQLEGKTTEELQTIVTELGLFAYIEQVKRQRNAN